MNNFAVFIICIQVYFIQNIHCQCINSVPSGASFGYNNGFGDVFYGSTPAVSYGGVGEGNVGVIGELPVSGTTTITGQVPIMGAVSFHGPVPAYGVVSITGSCACNCGTGNPYMY